MPFLFDTPAVDLVETPSQEETEHEIKERLTNERKAQAAFFSSLREDGAEELRKPTTGLHF